MRGLPDFDDDESLDEEEESEVVAQAEFPNLAEDDEDEDSRDAFGTAAEEEAMDED